MPEETNEERRICCFAIGSFIKGIMRFQIVGCVLRMIFWLFIFVLVGRGLYIVDQGDKLVPDRVPPLTEDEMLGQRRVYVAVVIVASFMILLYGVGLFLGAWFLHDFSNKMESFSHLITWHVYAALSLFFSLIFDVILIMNSYGGSIILIVLTISLNAYTIEAVKIQREGLGRKDSLELSVHSAEEN
ncbi:unnamed protein product [Allacma fusca]|uniref:Uncharacterized protein n=1 Tax=Allacma fusca TaxID=39272 RepID=A0A8J2KDL6_9HEXA|nr:unnamed protein product [Allacma fusca]